MELKDLLKSLAELDEMEAEDGMNLAESENARKVLVKVSYDGKELDSFDIARALPEEFDKEKITTEIEVL